MRYKNIEKQGLSHQQFEMEKRHREISEAEAKAGILELGDEYLESRFRGGFMWIL